MRRYSPRHWPRSWTSKSALRPADIDRIAGRIGGIDSNRRSTVCDLVIVLCAVAARIRRQRHRAQSQPRSHRKRDSRVYVWQSCRSLRAQLKLRLIGTPSQLCRRQPAHHAPAVEPFVAFPDVVRIRIGRLLTILLCTLTLRYGDGSKEGRCQCEERQELNMPPSSSDTLTHLPVSEGKPDDSM
jgi:hypothetical protein